MAQWNPIYQRIVILCRRTGFKSSNSQLRAAPTIKWRVTWYFISALSVSMHTRTLSICVLWPLGFEVSLHNYQVKSLVFAFPALFWHTIYELSWHASWQPLSWRNPRPRSRPDSAHMYYQPRDSLFAVRFLRCSSMAVDVGRLSLRWAGPRS